MSGFVKDVAATIAAAKLNFLLIFFVVGGFTFHFSHSFFLTIFVSPVAAFLIVAAAVYLAERNRLKSERKKEEGIGKKPITTFPVILKEAWLVFCGIDEEDEAKEMAEKIAKTASKGAAYSLSDNLLTALSPITIGFLIWLGWGKNEITIAMWIEDIAIAYGFVLFSRSVIEDFTLSEALRNSIDSIRRNGRIGKIVANILTVGILIRFSLWDGPERVAIFFHKELPKKRQEFLVVVAFSLIQAIFWTKVYSLGIKGWVDMWKLFT